MRDFGLCRAPRKRGNPVRCGFSIHHDYLWILDRPRARAMISE